MPGIQDIYNTFMGQTDSALNAPEQPWQQELLETVNPEKVKRQSIKKALAQASMAMATTPGNFLTGLSAAASTGANSYIDAQDQAEQDRIKAQQLIQVAQQKQQDRRLSLLMDAIGVDRNLKSDKREEAETTYRHGRDAKSDARQEKLDNSLISYREKGRNGNASGLSPAQVQTTKRTIRKELDDLEKSLRKPDPLSDAPPLSEEEIQQKLEERKAMLGNYYGIDVDSSNASTPTVAQPGAGILPAQSAAPTPIAEGATAVNPTTGARIIFKGGKWQPTT